MHRIVNQSDKQLAQLQNRLRYRFKSRPLLRLAMTHSSAADTPDASNERLEFLGDAVAGLIINEQLYRLEAGLTEGDMTKRKSAIVSSRGMAAAGRRLGLQQYLIVDRGLSQQDKFPPSVVAGAYEAVVGAIFLDGGYARCRTFVLRTLGPELAEADEAREPPNFKAILQELVQARSMGPPTYRTVKKTGPQHSLRFMAACLVGGARKGAGWGSTKKEAEQNAARAALEHEGISLE